MARPSFWCPVCGERGHDVEAGPEAWDESKRLFAEHLDRHTQPELTAFVWEIMYNHGASAGIRERV